MVARAVSDAIWPRRSNTAAATAVPMAQIKTNRNKRTLRFARDKKNADKKVNVGYVPSNCPQSLVESLEH